MFNKFDVAKWKLFTLKKKKKHTLQHQKTHWKEGNIAHALKTIFLMEPKYDFKNRSMKNSQSTNV